VPLSRYDSKKPLEIIALDREGPKDGDGSWLEIQASRPFMPHGTPTPLTASTAREYLSLDPRAMRAPGHRIARWDRASLCHDRAIMAIPLYTPGMTASAKDA